MFPLSRYRDPGCQSRNPRPPTLPDLFGVALSLNPKLQIAQVAFVYFKLRPSMRHLHTWSLRLVKSRAFTTRTWDLGVKRSWGQAILDLEPSLALSKAPCCCQGLGAWACGVGALRALGALGAWGLGLRVWAWRTCAEGVGEPGFPQLEDIHGLAMRAVSNGESSTFARSPDWERRLNLACRKELRRKVQMSR